MINKILILYSVENKCLKSISINKLKLIFLHYVGKMYFFVVGLFWNKLQYCVVKMMQSIVIFSTTTTTKTIIINE